MPTCVVSCRSRLRARARPLRPPPALELIDPVPPQPDFRFLAEPRANAEREIACSTGASLDTSDAGDGRNIRTQCPRRNLRAPIPDLSCSCSSRRSLNLEAWGGCPERGQGL